MNLGRAMDVLRRDMCDILHQKPGTFCETKRVQIGLESRSGCHRNLTRARISIISVDTDFSIYHESISAIDPSGVQLTGLDKYKSAFAFFQTFISFWFSRRSGLQYRMVYDFCRSSIRISWNAVLVPKVPLILGGPWYVDGISYYQLDRVTGKIVEHRIEKLMINNTPVAPPYGILSILQQESFRVRKQQGVPVGIGAMIGE
jgi:Uncharacterized conserved protein (DUF2358)